MSTRLSAGRVRATYEFIKTHRHEYSVHTMCRVLEVSRAGYYSWCKRPESKRANSDRVLLARIRAVHEESRRTYGLAVEFPPLFSTLIARNPSG
jgi:hypothetical protein